MLAVWGVMSPFLQCPNSLTSFTGKRQGHMPKASGRVRGITRQGIQLGLPVDIHGFSWAKCYNIDGLAEGQHQPSL